MGTTRQQILAKYRERYTKLCSHHEGFPGGSLEAQVAYFDNLGLEAAKWSKRVFGEFSDWVVKEAKALGVKKIWLSGRDSLPLVNLGAESQIKVENHPFCRGNLFYAYSNRFNLPKARLQKQAVLDYYHRGEIASEPVVIVDFGFFGTLERTHRLILEEAGLTSDFIKGHLLFLKTPRAIGDTTVFDKGIAPGFFDKAKLPDLIKSDMSYGERVKGYFDSQMGNRPRFMGDGFTYEEMDLPFIFWLQESGSGTKDSKFDLSGGNFDELRFGSQFQLTYWESFARGIADQITQGRGDINMLYAWFKENEPILREVIAIEDRDICKVIPTYEKFIEEMNQELAANGFQMATLVDSSAYPAPS